MATRIAPLLAVLAFLSTIALAQQYPTKPIRIVMTSGPDALPRMVGRKLTEAWGQQVIIDPQGGGGGLMSGSVAAKAAPDGYTLLLATGSHTISPSFYKLPYDMVRDFEPICLVATIPFLLVVNNTLPAKSVAEFIKLAKARPGELNFASGGNGSPGQLFAEMFKHITGTNMVHIPYKTLPNALTDVISGQVQLMFTVGPLALPQIKSGRVRALGVTTATRSRLMPEFPTLAESGVPGYDAMSWNGFLAPAGTPAAIIAKLHDEIAKQMNSTEIAEHVAQLGYEPTASTPQQLGELIKSELVKWAKVAQQAGLKPN
jgi:tripartite-type tricarboxylate transporter receptor subunit TctC